MATELKRMVQRRDTTARWTGLNPVLREGELGVDTDLDRVKIGDGVSVWTDLTFLNLTPGDVEGVIATEVPARVIAALAADDTPAQAAAAAVDTALDDAGVLHDAYEVEGIGTQGIAFVVTDSEGRRSWLEVGTDGAPTPRVLALFAASITGVAVQVTALGHTYTITDSDNREAFYVDQRGRVGFVPDEPTLARFLAVAGEVKVSGPDMVAYGDSLTAGAGGAGTTWPGIVQAALAASGSTATVRNAGVGGENSVTITARANATPLLMIANTGSIAASGPTPVTLQPINGVMPAPLLQGDGGGSSGVLWTPTGPVPGTIGINAGVYQFTRRDAGGTIPLTRPSAFRYDFGDARRLDVALIAIGQNGPGDQRAIEDARAIVQEMDGSEKRWLFLSRPSTSDAGDALYDAAFGRRHIAVRKYLVTYGLSDAGINPTQGDLDDQAAGIVPRSLRVDSVHGNAAYYTIVGNLVVRRLREMGWITA